MNQEEKDKLADEVLTRLAHMCKFYKVDYFSLDKITRDLILGGFQEGIQYMLDKEVKLTDDPKSANIGTS